MTINATYIATVLNSMIRMTSPILLAALTAAICNKVKVFNIGMEGTMMSSQWPCHFCHQCDLHYPF